MFNSKNMFLKCRLNATRERGRERGGGGRGNLGCWLREIERKLEG